MTSPSPDDVHCTALINGDIDRVRRCDAERGWRYVIALLQDDKPAIEQIFQQIGDCPDCLRALAAYFGAQYTVMLQERFGQEIALKAAQHTLVEILSSPDLDDPDFRREILGIDTDTD